jgi:ribosomal protein L24E
VKKCCYCGKSIEDEQLAVKEDGDWYHLVCAAQEADGNDLSNSFGG